jgi:hypothetical protein
MKYRFEGKYVEEFADDFAALENCNSYYDDRAASIEKEIDGSWCYHTTPISHPYSKIDGWVLPNGEILPSCED